MMRHLWQRLPVHELASVIMQLLVSGHTFNDIAVALL